MEREREIERERERERQFLTKMIRNDPDFLKIPWALARGFWAKKGVFDQIETFLTNRLAIKDETFLAIDWQSMMRHFSQLIGKQ